MMAVIGSDSVWSILAGNLIEGIDEFHGITQSVAGGSANEATGNFVVKVSVFHYFALSCRGLWIFIWENSCNYLSNSPVAGDVASSAEAVHGNIERNHHSVVGFGEAQNRR